MINISYGPNIANLPLGSAFWSWTLPSNNSNPWGKLENPTNIVDLIDFLICPLMNFIGKEAL